MSIKNRDGLTIRQLESKDAPAFVRISYGESMFQYLSYFQARSVIEAEKIISDSNRCGNLIVQKKLGSFETESQNKNHRYFFYAVSSN